MWVLIAAAVASGTFLICEHLGVGVAPGVALNTSGVTAEPAATSGADASWDGSTDVTSDAAATAVPMQQFSNDGYAFSVPARWNIERTASDTIAIHPDASSSLAACKIEVSAFPYTGGANGMADWISHRIGADPSLVVAERSSEDVSFSGGTGVKWIGTIDDIPTTLVYAFNESHAYEIAPSAIGEGADGAPQCDSIVNKFISTLTI